MPISVLCHWPLLSSLVSCRSEFVTGNSAGGVRIFSADRPSVGRVGVDIAAEFARQVRDRGEKAGGDNLAFDLREPNLALLAPGGVRGREGKPDSWRVG